MIASLGTVNRIIAMLPPDCKESLTLKSRQPRETEPSSVTYSNARRCKATYEEQMFVASQNGVLGVNWIVFELFKTTEATDPKNGDSITDASSVTWQVKKIGVVMMGRIFRCTCLKNV